MSQPDHEAPATEGPARKAGLPVRIAFYLGVVLSAVFLVISIVSWSLPLGACALVLALVLFKNIDLVGGFPEAPAAPRTPQ